MNKSFFALVLLLSSAVASASVKVDISAKYGEAEMQETVELTKEANSVEFGKDAGARTVVTLENETAEAADLNVKIFAKDGETVHQDATIKAEYGKEASLKCESEKMEAELVLVANSTSVAKAE